MSRFDERWLALREPCDHAARSATLAARFAAAQGPAPYIVDLGAGSGSNLRYLGPLLPPGQRWMLLDHDAALLAAAAARGGGVGEIACRALDLSRELPAALGRTGITAAALLDLTSAAWLDELARWCGKTPVLVALSVDGRLFWQPEDPEDSVVRQRFFAHQRTDKGFGPALGPSAAAYLARRLEGAGQRVVLERSDWRLGPIEAPPLAATLDGILAAVAEIAGPTACARWSALRRRQLAAGALRLTVGHVDLLALPA